MQAERQADVISEYEKIDLEAMLQDYWRCLKKYWLQFLLFAVIAAIGAVGFYNWKYMPEYSAKITYAVYKTSDTAIDGALARRLSQALPVLTGMKDFKNDLFHRIEENTINENFSFQSSYTEGGTLFEVSVNANNYQNANTLLKIFKEIYPEWASKSVGTVELQIVDESEASESPSVTHSPLLSAAKGALAGVFICFLLATIYVLTMQTVRKEGDMRKVTSSNCIALLPEVKLKKRMLSTKSLLLLTNKRVDWGLKQSVLAAQSRIENVMSADKRQILMVTSTLPREGKSMISVNLAIAFAQKGRKVLLLDADFRKPSVETVLGLEETKGLSDYFKAGVKLEGLIKQQDGIDILPGGTISGAASGIINKKEMEGLMETLKKEYEYIIIDTPPACMFTDAAMMSKYADAVVYAVCHDMAAVRQIREGIAPFIQNQKLIGYLINRNPGGFSSYGKYGRYGSYSRYGHYSKYKRYIELDEKEMNTEETL